MELLDFILNIFTSKNKKEKEPTFEEKVSKYTMEELKDDYEKRRIEMLKNGTDKTYEMKYINKEINRRLNEEYLKNNPNPKPRSREHGWYLENDD